MMASLLAKPFAAREQQVHVLDNKKDSSGGLQSPVFYGSFAL